MVILSIYKQQSIRYDTMLSFPLNNITSGVANGIKWTPSANGFSLECRVLTIYMTVSKKDTARGLEMPWKIS